MVIFAFSISPATALIDSIAPEMTLRELTPRDYLACAGGRGAVGITMKLKRGTGRNLEHLALAARDMKHLFNIPVLNLRLIGFGINTQLSKYAERFNKIKDAGY